MTKLTTIDQRRDHIHDQYGHRKSEWDSTTYQRDSRSDVKTVVLTLEVSYSDQLWKATTLSELEAPKLSWSGVGIKDTRSYIKADVSWLLCFSEMSLFKETSAQRFRRESAEMWVGISNFETRWTLWLCLKLKGDECSVQRGARFLVWTLSFVPLEIEISILNK